MLLKDIKIYSCFWVCPPSEGKMEEKRQYLKENGRFQSEITLNSANYLIDGFTSYLLARECGIMEMPVRYGRRQIIRARHAPDGKLYAWELPQRLIDQVSVGDMVAVHTKRGVRCVTVAAVEEWIPQEGVGRLNKAIKRKKTDGRGD